MNCIEKLFKKYPFIYFLNDKYYAFGTRVCAECGTDSLLLPSKYRKFEESISERLTTKEAWKIFHALMCEADYVKDKKGICLHPEEEFLKYHFGEEEMNELKRQIERYEGYWKKYEFNTFLH